MGTFLSGVGEPSISSLAVVYVDGGRSTLSGTSVMGSRVLDES
jgi:hypothetical protein